MGFVINGVEIPTEVTLLATCIWVFIGAVFIMPYFVNRRVERPKGTVSKIKKEVLDEIDDKFEEMKKEFPKIPEFPQDIPTLKEVHTAMDNVGVQLTANINNLQDQVPKLVVSALQTPEFETEFKRFEGRMWRAKGVDLEKMQGLTLDHQKGYDAAKQVYLQKIENPDPNDKSELKMILFDALKIAEDGGLIDEGSAEQKMGMIHGVLDIVQRLQNRGNNGNTSSLGAGHSPAPSPLKSQGNEIDSYYR